MDCKLSSAERRAKEKREPPTQGQTTSHKMMTKTSPAGTTQGPGRRASCRRQCCCASTSPKTSALVFLHKSIFPSSFTLRTPWSFCKRASTSPFLKASRELFLSRELKISEPSCPCSQVEDAGDDIRDDDPRCAHFMEFGCHSRRTSLLFLMSVIVESY